MTEIFQYIIKVNIALLLLFFIYRILFRNDTFFHLRRFTLLAIYLIAFLYPIPDISIWVSRQANLAEVVSLYTVIVSPYAETAVQELATSYSVKDILFMILSGLSILGTVVLLTRFIIELFIIIRQYRQSHYQKINGVKVALLTKDDPPYSFFKWIFVYPDGKTERAIKEILIHEQTHARQLHSIDIIISEAVCVLFWMNPIVWLIKNEIVMNHEYIADQEVVRSGFDKKAYQYHLIGVEHTNKAAARIYNNFSVLPLKKRITMLNKQRTKGMRRIKYLLIIPIAMTLLLFNNVDAMARLINPEASPVEVLPAELSGITGTLAPQQGDNAVYEQVDKMPEFPGGEIELLKFVSRSIVYPQESQDKGEEGRNIVSFIVEKDGSLSTINVEKEITPALDAESIRVIKTMPKWTPGEHNGKIVRTKFKLPLVYRLQ